MSELLARQSLVLEKEDLSNAQGNYGVRVRIATTDMARAPNGLPISPDHEDVQLWFAPDYPDEPPTALVAHDRFAGQPHVLLGRLLCIYLDPTREWHPALGVDGAVDRLVQWLRDAAAGTFDSRTALYHPIGGLPPSPRGPGTLVVREPPPAGLRPISRAVLTLRADWRCDVLRWSTRTDYDDRGTTEALVLAVPNPMPFGLVNSATLGDLCARVEHSGGASSARTIAAVAHLIVQLPDEMLRIIVEVAHPDDPSLSYLACALAPMPHQVAQAVGESDLPSLSMAWMSVSDERPAVATRRDVTRPTAAFHGRSVEVWGCGGLGSWIAEFIARAGSAHMMLRDTGGVSGGLLVRQNYLETDVGRTKVASLARRIADLSDTLQVEADTTNVLQVLRSGFSTTADVIIDATVNATVAGRLDEWARGADNPPLLASVATDPRTATLGLLLVADSGLGVGPATVDDSTWANINQDPGLERFQGFWQSPDARDQFVPGLGCSTPTFHGSAADVASLAGSLVSLLASHLEAGVSGAHLIESSHARGSTGGGHHFVAYP